jgi:hypothetical protein
MHGGNKYAQKFGCKALMVEETGKPGNLAVDGTDNINMDLMELLKPAPSGTKTPRVLPGRMIVHDIKIHLREGGQCSTVQHALQYLALKKQRATKTVVRRNVVTFPCVQ